MKVIFENEDLSMPVSAAEKDKWTQWAEDEYNKIIEFANNILNFTLSDCVDKLIFDGEKPEPVVYPGLSEEELCEQLVQANGLLKREDVRYTEGIWYTIKRGDFSVERISIEYKSAMNYLNNNIGQNEKRYLDEIRDILSRQGYSFTPAGTYFSNPKEIRLYYNVYEKNNFEEFVSIFSHELFHAFHHAETADTFVSTRYHAKVVKEASADFFSFLYCKEKGFNKILESL